MATYCRSAKGCTLYSSRCGIRHGSDRLIEYVRVQTGKGCSRKLISKWKKSVNSEQLSVISKLTKNGQDKSEDNNTNVLSLVNFSEQNPLDSNLTESMSEINQAEPEAIQTVDFLESQANISIICDQDKPEIAHQTSLPVEEEVTSNKRSLNEKPKYHSQLFTGHWSLFTVIAIVCGIVGASWFFSKDNSKPVIAQPTSIQNSEFKVQNTSPESDSSLIQNPKSKIQNPLPRTFKISLTVTSPQDLKVKPGDEIALGQVLSDRTTERQRLLAQKKQLEISLKKLDLPIPELTQPKPIPALSTLPPVSYQQEEANIALKQQELAEAEKAIALTFFLVKS